MRSEKQVKRSAAAAGRRLLCALAAVCLVISSGLMPSARPAEAAASLSFSVPSSASSISAKRITPIEPVDLMQYVSGGTGPYTFQKVSGPSWITVLSDGVVCGVPKTTSDTGTLRVRVTDSNGNSKEATLSVSSISATGSASEVYVYYNRSGYDYSVLSSDSSCGLYMLNGGGRGSSSNYNVKYDPATGILTLKDYDGGPIDIGGFNVSGGNSYPKSGPAYIELIGENTIKHYGKGSPNYGIQAGCDSDVVIGSASGGSLFIELTNTVDDSQLTGIKSCGRQAVGTGVESRDAGSITICGDASVTIQVFSQTVQHDYSWTQGIQAFNDVYIVEHASVDIYANGADAYSSSVTNGGPRIFGMRGFNNKGGMREKLVIATDGTVKSKALCSVESQYVETYGAEFSEFYLYSAARAEFLWDQYKTQSQMQQYGYDYKTGDGLKIPESSRCMPEYKFIHTVDRDAFIEVYEPDPDYGKPRLIDSVDVTLNRIPSIGLSPSAVKGSIKGGQNVEIVSQGWFVNTGGSLSSNDYSNLKEWTSPFVAGKTYYYKLYVRPINGYSFDGVPGSGMSCGEPVSYTVNGSAGTLGYLYDGTPSPDSETDGCLRYLWRFNIPASSYNGSIQIALETPQAGDSIAALKGSVPGGALYSLSGESWYRKDGDSLPSVPEETEFIDGATYVYRAMVYPPDSYQFVSQGENGYAGSISVGGFSPEPAFSLGVMLGLYDYPAYYNSGKAISVSIPFTVGTQVLPPDPPQPQGLRGDVDLSGTVDAADLTALARHVSNISQLSDPQAIANADVTDDEQISAADLTKLARYVAKIIDEL